MTKKQESKKVLELLGMPTEQQSDICCYSLLALLNLSSSSSWSAATNEWTRIHDILAFLRKTYRGVRYAENSRETFRKQAMHQGLWYGQVGCGFGKVSRRPSDAAANLCFQEARQQG